MKITKVTAVYYSAVGSTKAVTEKIAGLIAEKLGVPTDSYDYTLPDSRTKTQNYGPSDLVVFGTSVYAGRVPNKLLPAVQNCFKADGALAVPVVTFGNRNLTTALSSFAMSWKTTASTQSQAPELPAATSFLKSWLPDVLMRRTGRPLKNLPSLQPKR